MTFDILVPELGESVLEATVFQWYKKEGDQIEIGDVLVELETDKVNLEVGAEQSGVLKRIDHQEGEDVKVGEVLGVIEEIDEDSIDQPDPSENKSSDSEEIEKTPQDAEEKKPSGEVDVSREKEPTATPLAKRVAKDNQVDISTVSGSGIGGRITKEDVKQHIDKEMPIQTPAQKPAPISSVTSEAQKREERIKMSRRRRTIAKHMVEAQQNAAILTTYNEIDMSVVMDLRRRRNPDFQEKHGFKLGITSFFIKAAIGALKTFPRVNAEIKGDQIVLKHYYDIGVAIGDEEGLVVPVIREADRLTFAEIEEKINSYVKAVREKTLAIEDLRGGTFSITNGGVFGSLLSTPILNPPQVGILGLHKIEPRPVAINDNVEIKPMMYVALSYDHRIIDGREAVQFLVRVKDLVEDPEQLLLEG